MSEFRVMQEGMEVARTSGPTLDAFREIIHYAEQYGEDGPTQIDWRESPNRRWVPFVR